MFKKIIITVLCLMLFYSFALAQEDTIKIGANVSLTGASSMWGISELNALKMAAEQINQDGGVLGKKIVIIEYDNRANPPEAVIVNQRLIDRDHVAAIIGLAQSGTFIAARTVAEEGKTPQIGTTATNPMATVAEDGKPFKYAFRVCFIDPFQGKIAANFAYNELKAKTASIVYDVGSDYSSWLADYFIENFTALGGKIVNEEAFRSGELDFRAILGKIKASPVDILYVPTMQKEAGLIAKQARDLGITAPFMGGDGVASPDLMTIGGEATEGFYFTNLADLADPLLSEWLEDYRAIYNTDPVLPNPVMAVDALLLVVDAIKRAGTTDGETLASAIENTKNIQVLTTDNFTIDPQTHNPLDKPAVINVVKDGKFEYVMSYSGEN
ncbi:MAG: ABC transporter substrate-binding protein [Candidatus Atribacteria bacterium]|nr:ABC transporter substrate-binding protein [Candidatus Atribacteria bacterium]